jgi:hypothetical protein
MPISTESTKLSIDFGYEWNGPNGDTFEYQMKFMHGPNGPVIQIGNGSETLELPADMFTETAEFLIAQGVLKGKAAPSLGRKPLGTALSVPTIVKNRVPQPMAKATVASRPMSQATVAPFASFDGEQEEMEEVPEKKQAKNPPRPLPMEERPDLTGTEGVTAEEAEAMRKERLQKKAKARAADKGGVKRKGAADSDDE